MKTFKSFKGTKGDFKPDVGYDEDDGRFSTQVYVPFEETVALVYGNTVEQCEANAKLFANAKNVLKELIHLVRLLEPLEKDGKLDVLGLVTLNGARQAINNSL